MVNNQPPDLAKVEDTLDQIAEWLIAVHGERISSIMLTLKGFYTYGEVYWSIVPRMERGNGGTRDTLPSREIQVLAEAAFQSVFPNAVFKKDNLWDSYDITRSKTVKSSEVSAHRRLALLKSRGRPCGKAKQVSVPSAAHV